MLWSAVNEGGPAGMATGSSDGDEMFGFGARGGDPSPLSRTFLHRGGEELRLKPHRMFDLVSGDVIVKRSAGGGGVGSPSDRDPEAVRVDVLNELVSIQAARDVYLVAIDPETLGIDHEATKALRSRGVA
jgi:N-methylhydantoinase B/acetone carboxylase, alpha subunit